MKQWSHQTEEEITLLIKDWLKQQGRTQADLRQSLQAESSRMSALLEVLQREYFLGGFPKVADRLCEIENHWLKKNTQSIETSEEADPFSQLDLLLEEMKNDNVN